MALDLFFVPSKLKLASAEDPDFRPNSTQIRARRSLLKAIAARFDGAGIADQEIVGTIDGFPRGELLAQPGYLHWSLHGVRELEPITEIIEWFFSQGMVCEDPQDAGFGNRERLSGKSIEVLNSWDALQGARLHSIEISGPGISGAILTWVLADHREAVLVFIHHEKLELPSNFSKFIDDRVVAVDVEPTDFEEFDGATYAMRTNFRFFFQSGAEIYCHRAVVKSFIARTAPPSKW